MAHAQPTNVRFHSSTEEKVSLSDQLTRFEDLRNGCDRLAGESKLLERFLNDAEMNDLSLIKRFFDFLKNAINSSRQNAAKIVLYLPGSNLLRFAYGYLRPSSKDKGSAGSLESFVLVLSKVLTFLLDLHPSCTDQLDSLGIFDRLESFAQKCDNEETQTTVTELISQVDHWRQQRQNQSKKASASKSFEQEEEQETNQPPPNDFHQLSIYPTIDDIFHTQVPYLRKNIVQGGFQNGTHYLDIHFRLLREDFLSPLREAICQYITDDSRATSFRNTNVRLYRNTILTGSSCSISGLNFSLQLDFTMLPKSISWNNSRRLIYGNLLAATFDDFISSCFLLTVEDRSQIETHGIITVRCQQELCDHKLMRIPPGTRFTLLETTSYFEAYRPILQALQNITDDRLPLEQYILHCNRDVDYPAYFQTKSDIDFRCLLVPTRAEIDAFEGTISDVKNPSTWPNADQMGFDSSQYEALKLAMTKAVALIQGPPGCGKTFLGVRLAELFYHNRTRITGCERPILMICYTNHALDQFLTSIIKKLSLKPGDVVRVGGRSTHSEVEPFLIQKLRTSRRDFHSRTQELQQKYIILNNIKRQLDQCSKQFEECCQKILNIEQLLLVMDREQFLELIDPVLRELDIFTDHWNRETGGIYCCGRLKSSSSSSDSDSDDEELDNTTDPPLSSYEKQQRMKNRINCYKLNKLSEHDQNIIDQLFVKWLDATQREMLIVQSRDQGEDDGQDQFEEKRSKRKKKQKNRAQVVLQEILSDNLLKSPPPSAEATTTTDDNKKVINIEDDEEEQRRLENIETPFIPFTNPTPSQKDTPTVDPQQLEYLHHLFTNRTTLLSDNEAKSIKDLWKIQREQRQSLYRYWLTKFITKLTDDWFDLNEQFDQNHQTMQKLWLDNDQKYMKDAFIIAMTTHCASRYQHVLKDIAPRICIVEEAAEVFESHIVTAVGEKIEHLILIGDHVQLRPSANVYTLAKDFKLDVSLFERLINNKMPSVQLNLQHRSIPLISSLTHHFYNIPIGHHESVKDRPSITGVTHPLYFITHQHSEENVADGASRRNSYEANYVLQLANYLINQGYNKSEITILTTYMGQRQQIQKTLRQHFEQLKGILITVVDNYQGEENRIVILSLVRSNSERRLGYIAVNNRICVALSRAQNGFYVIGNFHMLTEDNETWKIIVNKVKALKMIGLGLPVHCIHHPDKEVICVQPDDFRQRPLGGCGLPCTTRLVCGHQCPLTCHTSSHDSLKCKKLCLKSYDDCEHQCPRQCHGDTPCLPCSEMITLKMPHCEHTCAIACFMRKNNKIECSTPVPFTCQRGHQVLVRCCDRRDRTLQFGVCNHPCKSILECGHLCKGTCSSCLEGRFHVPCNENEMIAFLCGHSRLQSCHEIGPRCEESFMKICDHEDSPSSDDDECVIHSCLRYCRNKCRHHTCGKRCSLPCERPPCHEKCRKRFDCEHYCNGICGEPCINCLKCRERDLPNAIRKEINVNQRYARFVQVECGHLISVDVFDRHIKEFEDKCFMSNGLLKVDYPRCPECQFSLAHCKRALSVIKPIHYRMTNSKTRFSTISIKHSMATLRRALIEDSHLPENVNTILKTHKRKTRHSALVDLFEHVVDILRNFDARIDVEREKLVRTIYDRIEKKKSIFFTRQQWLDLEREYNRLYLIDLFRKTQEKDASTLDSSVIETLNDILFGGEELTKGACEVCYAILGNNDKKEGTWQSIYPAGRTLHDYERDQLLCNGKWFVYAPCNHLEWHSKAPENFQCSTCVAIEADIDPTIRPYFGMTRSRRGGFQ